MSVPTTSHPDDRASDTFTKRVMTLSMCQRHADEIGLENSAALVDDGCVRCLRVELDASKAFYEVAIKERNYERIRATLLEQSIRSLLERVRPGSEAAPWVIEELTRMIATVPR